MQEYEVGRTRKAFKVRDCGDHWKQPANHGPKGRLCLQPVDENSPLERPYPNQMTLHLLDTTCVTELSRPFVYDNIPMTRELIPRFLKFAEARGQDHVLRFPLEPSS